MTAPSMVKALIEAKRRGVDIRVITDGGTRTSGGDRITVAGANSATIVFSAGTNYAQAYPSYRGADPHAPSD